MARPFRRLWLLLVAVALVALAAVVTPTSSAAAGTLLSQGKPTTASSSENATFSASAATDGNPGTRWSSTFSDPQWLQVDLGTATTVNHATLIWEASAASAYQIQTSNDATNWTTIFTNNNATGEIQDVSLSGSGRFIRVLATARASAFGDSLYEFAVYGASSGGGGGGGPGGGTLLSQGKPATASSVENTGTPAANAVDGNTATRWSSTFTDPQWLQVDLGASATVDKVVLNWEAAYATGYQIQISNDNVNWTSIYSTTTGTGGTQTLEAVVVITAATGDYLAERFAEAVVVAKGPDMAAQVIAEGPAVVRGDLFDCHAAVAHKNGMADGVVGWGKTFRGAFLSHMLDRLAAAFPVP